MCIYYCVWLSIVIVNYILMYVFELYYVLFDYCLEYFGVMFSFYKDNI